MADSDAVLRAESGMSLIEEEEVETKPEQLISYTDVLLCPETQTAAEPYFSTDAWQLVLNTLKVLEDIYIVNTQKKYDMISPSRTRKGKALIGSAKGRIFKKCSKNKSDQIDSGKRNVYSFTSEDSSPLKAMEGKTDKKSSRSDDRSPLKATDGRRNLNILPSAESSPVKATYEQPGSTSNPDDDSKSTRGKFQNTEQQGSTTNPDEDSISTTLNSTYNLEENENISSQNSSANKFIGPMIQKRQSRTNNNSEISSSTKGVKKKRRLLTWSNSFL